MPQPTRLDPSTPPPIAGIMALSFLASVGTYVVESGVFFLTEHTYHFSLVENYTLGVALGITYILGAALASRWIALAKRSFPRLKSRGILTAMMLLMTLLCAVPWAAKRWAGGDPDHPAHWPMWVLVLTYTPLTGILWPMVESYVSGGRSGDRLRSTMGWWNVVWSSALIVGSVGMAPFVKDQAAEVIAALAFLHLLAAGLTRVLSPEPAPHPAEGPHHCPPVYARLLVTFRFLLPASYLVSSAMIPFLPELMKDKLQIPAAMHTVYGATWLASRTLMFAVLQRTSGWHGRWWLPSLGLASLLGGFALTALSFRVGGVTLGLPILLAGLGVFGVGMGAVYMGAIYYAMEVGKAEVDAGGTHEALIGVGYSAGPGLGLVAAAALQRGWIEPQSLEPTVLLAVAGITLIVAGFVVERIWRLGRSPGSEPASGES